MIGVDLDRKYSFSATVKGKAEEDYERGIFAETSGCTWLVRLKGDSAQSSTNDSTVTRRILFETTHFNFSLTPR